MGGWFCANFTHREVGCRCCGVSKMSGRTMAKFQKARGYLGRPIYGHSWCRCESHNEAVGGVPGSSHKFTDQRLSCAGDVTLVPPGESRDMTSAERLALLCALQYAGFNRFGMRPGFIHTDDDPDKPQNVLWLD